MVECRRPGPTARASFRTTRASPSIGSSQRACPGVRGRGDYWAGGNWKGPGAQDSYLNTLSASTITLPSGNFTAVRK